MNAVSRRAFTLIEMLVVVLLIGLLIAILVPVLGSSKRTAKESLCQWNTGQLMTAVNLYLEDHNNIYPGGEPTVRLEDGSTQTVEINAWNIVGVQGVEDGDSTEEALRPLNVYLGDRGIARCPMDEGTSLSAAIGLAATHYDTFGSSYYYLAREPDRIDDRRKVIQDGALMVGGHRKSEFTRPDRKAVLADAVLPVTYKFDGAEYFPGDHPLNQWHSDGEELITAQSTARRLKVTMGFVDGHAEKLRRRASAAWIPKPNPNIDASDSDVNELLIAPGVADSSEADELYY